MRFVKYLLLIPLFFICYSSVCSAALMGDANGNGQLDLGEAIIIFQTMVGLRPDIAVDTSIGTVSGIVKENNNNSVEGGC